MTASRTGCASAAPAGSRATRRRSSPANSGPARRGLELGLVDGLGELRATLQARYGAKVHLPVIAARRRLLSRFGLGSARSKVHRAQHAAPRSKSACTGNVSDFRSLRDEASHPVEPEDLAAVRAWFDALSKHCRAIDYEGARPIFAEDMIAFGTFTDFMHRPRPRRAEAVAQRLGHDPQLPLRSRQDRGHRLGRPADRRRHGRVAVRRLPSQRRPLRPAAAAPR